MRNSNLKVTDDDIIRAMREAVTVTGASNLLEINRRTLQRRLKSLAYKGYAPDHDMTRTTPDGFMVTGTSTLYNEDGKIKSQWVKTRQDPEQMEALMQAALDGFLTEIPKLPKRPKVSAASYNKDLMVCYPIGDAHIGMRAWGEECGDDWDLEIAERIQCAAMDALVKSAPDSEQATIVNLGDWFHYDSMESKTPRSGHMLDSDGRYAKVIRIGIKVMRQCIESALSKHKTVHVVNVIGNHDETGALWLAATLAHVYENEKRVTVETSPSLFSYIEFGKNLIGMHHGHTCKPDKLPGVMAADKAEAWGRTLYRQWWLGHVHHQSVKEYPGCTVETFNTLAFKDAYAAAGGWRSHENMKAVILHRDHGEVGRLIVHPKMLS